MLTEHSVQNTEQTTANQNHSFTLSAFKNQTSIPSAENVINETPLGKFRSLLTEIVSANDYSLIIYSSILTITIILTIAACLEFVRHCIIASAKLHNRMFNKIVYSPMKFFNENPSGRILNRFSKDIGNVDEALPVTMIDTIHVSLLSSTSLTEFPSTKFK